MRARTSLALVALLVGAAGAQELRVRAAADYSKGLDGCAVLIYRDGKLVFEEYQNGYKASKPHHIYSGTKSFAPTIALIAQSEGLLELDEPVVKTIPEWQSDTRKRAITIRQLLNFTSGIKNIDNHLHRRSSDKYGDAVAAPGSHVPGKRFNYGSQHLMVFGEVMRRKLEQHPEKDLAGKDALAYLKKRVLDPIGLKVGFWLRDAERNPALPYGAFLTARNWAKYGQLILARGRFGKRQLIPAKHFDAAFQGSPANPVYGLNWWLVGKRERARGFGNVPKDTVGALGMYNQKLYVIPSAKIVIVRFGKSPSRKRFRGGEFLNRLFAAKAAGQAPKKRAGQGGRPR